MLWTQTGEGQLFWLPWGRALPLTHTSHTWINLDAASHLCLPLPWTSVTSAGSKLLINMQTHARAHTHTYTDVLISLPCFITHAYLLQSKYMAKFGPVSMCYWSSILSLPVSTHTCTHSQHSRAKTSSSLVYLPVFFFTFGGENTPCSWIHTDLHAVIDCIML